MRIIDAAALSGFARKTAQLASDFASVVHELIMDVRDSYRPEQYYMRGPGPERRAKHNLMNSPAADSSAARPSYWIPAAVRSTPRSRLDGVSASSGH